MVEIKCCISSWVRSSIFSQQTGRQKVQHSPWETVDTEYRIEIQHGCVGLVDPSHKQTGYK